MAIFANLESKTYEQLSAGHDRLRRMHIAHDGFIDPMKNYPDLDEIAHEMFRRLSGGTDHIVLSAEWIKANATVEG